MHREKTKERTNLRHYKRPVTLELLLPLPLGEGWGEGGFRELHLKNQLWKHVCISFDRPHPDPLPEGEGTGCSRLRHSSISLFMRPPTGGHCR